MKKTVFVQDFSYIIPRTEVLKFLLSNHTKLTLYSHILYSFQGAFPVVS